MLPAYYRGKPIDQCRCSRIHRYRNASPPRLPVATRVTSVVSGAATPADQCRWPASTARGFAPALGRLEAGDRPGALEALAVLYEGRQCARLSARAYAFERSFWAGEGGWSSRFGHRAPPPLPAFDAACRALRDGRTDGAMVTGLEAARAEAMQAALNAVALVTAKLRAATLRLRGARS
jgi:hypothetical protein